jgi:zinc protease
MAVMAVGDFDPQAIEAAIKSHFSTIPTTLSATPRPKYDVPPHAGTLYTVVTDPEATATTISVVSKIPAREQTSIGAYRQSLVERLYSGMLSARLDEISHKPDAPFLAAETNRGLFVRTAEATSLNALVQEGGIEKGLTAMFTEADRVARFGFTAAELERQKANMQRGMERASAERDAQESASLADEYVRNFTTDEPIPGLPYEYVLYTRFLPQITLAEVNALAKDWIPDRSRVVAITAPQKPDAPVPDEAKLAAAIKAASNGTLTAYTETIDSRPLLDPLPAATGAVTAAAAKPQFGITEWTLANGVRVVLAPTTFKQDEILFRAVSPGGTSLASDADFVPAETAAEVIGAGGLGRFSETNLEKVLAGKNVGVRPEIAETFEGLRGGSSRKDLETMFQLIYMTFTQPRADGEAYQTMLRNLRQTLANRSAQPETAFNDTLEDALSQGHLRSKPLSPALINQMNLDKTLAFYKDRFADASDFTFVFVGSFDVDGIKPLVEKYLGTLPALRRRETARDTGMRPPAGIVDRKVVKGLDPKSEVTVVFTGQFQNDQAHRILLRAMAETLEGNLQRLLREDLGGTYGVSVRPNFEKVPQQAYRLTISFACDPTRTDDLVKTLFRAIDDFRASGPSAGQIADARLALVRDLETNSRENGYLLNQLAFKYQYNEDVGEVFNLRTFYDQLTASAVRDAARMYLDPTHYVRVTLMPETAAANR